MKVYRLGIPGYHGLGSQVGMDGPTLKVGDIQSTCFLWKVWTFSFVEVGEHVMFGERAYDHPGPIEASAFCGYGSTGKMKLLNVPVPELCWRIEG